MNSFYSFQQNISERQSYEKFTLIVKKGVYNIQNNIELDPHMSNAPNSTQITFKMVAESPGTAVISCLGISLSTGIKFVNFQEVDIIGIVFSNCTSTLSIYGASITIFDTDTVIFSNIYLYNMTSLGAQAAPIILNQINNFQLSNSMFEQCISSYVATISVISTQNISITSSNFKYNSMLDSTGRTSGKLIAFLWWKINY